MSKRSNGQKSHLQCWSQSWGFLLVSGNCNHERLPLQCWSQSWECQLVSGNCNQQRHSIQCWSQSRGFPLVSGTCNPKRPHLQCWSQSWQAQLSPKLYICEMPHVQCLWFQVGSSHRDLDPSLHPYTLPSQRKGHTKQVKFHPLLPNQLRSRSNQPQAQSLLVAKLLDDLEGVHLGDT